MITIDELKVQLADYGKAVKDLEEALNKLCLLASTKDFILFIISRGI